MWKNTLSLWMTGVHCEIAAYPFSIFESKTMDFHKEIHMKSCLLFTLMETHQYDMIQCHTKYRYIFIALAFI